MLENTVVRFKFIEQRSMLSGKDPVFSKVIAVMNHTPNNTAPISEAKIAGKTSSHGKTWLGLGDFIPLLILLSAGDNK